MSDSYVAPVYRVLLWHKDEIIEIHTLDIEPTGSKSRYRALTSMQCLQNRELEMRFGEKRKKNLPPFHLGIFENKAPFDKLEEMRKARAIERGTEYEDYWAEYPHFHHESLWDFYKAVGYDYKSKKWTRPLPN